MSMLLEYGIWCRSQGHIPPKVSVMRFNCL
uniref:Uncharacterized protein n=1 Tax=Anguilla anguilla TaxID=7936 RepID=A0A0E9Q3F2_ANGAN